VKSKLGGASWQTVSPVCCKHPPSPYNAPAISGLDGAVFAAPRFRAAHRHGCSETPPTWPALSPVVPSHAL